MRVSEKKALQLGWIKKSELRQPTQDKRNKPEASLRANNDAPQRALYEALKSVIPETQAEHKNAVPGRRYRIDCAIPSAKIAIELDGWEWHGKHKNDFARDRARDRALTLNGWRIMRFTAKEVHHDLKDCVTQVLTLLRTTHP